MKRTLLLFAALLSLSTGVFAERATLAPEKGWTLLSKLPDDVSQYFFAIYDNYDTGKALVLDAGVNQGTGNKTMWYRTDVNPETNKAAMWAFDGFDNNNYSGATEEYVKWVVITGVGDMDKCLHTNDGREWNYRAENNGEGWTDRAYVITSYLPAGCWTRATEKFKTVNIGHWESTDEIAGNATDDKVGHYDLYAITRGQYVAVAEDIYSATEANPIDISYVITNADATRKNNFHASQPVGWTLSQDDAFECEFASYLPSKVGDSYFNKWQGSGNLTDRSMSQTVTGLPSGRYRLSVRTHSSTIAAGANLFANSDKTALNTVTESNVVSVTTTVTDGHLTFGVELKDYQSNNCKFDHFTLEYLGWSFPVAFGASGFATFASDYPVALPDDESIKGYTASVSDATINFNKLTDKLVPANTGVMLSGTANTTMYLPVVAEADAQSSDFIRGTGAAPGADDDYYFFAIKKSAAELTFGTFNPATLVVAKNKAYLKIAKDTFGSGTARLTLRFDDATAINAIEATEAEDGALKDGKYLIEGKIVLVKNGVKYGANGQKLN